MIIEELKVVVKTEADKATKKMKQFQGVTDKADKTSGKMGKTLGQVKTSTLAMAGAIAGGIAVIKKIADVAGVWINAASDAEEISSKFAVTFSEMAVSAQAAAIDLADSYGLAETTAKDLLSATGDMLSGFGATTDQALDLSTRTQQLAVDLASFTNYAGGAAGASQALTRGLLGERESMKSLGIAIQEADVQQRLLEKGQKDLEGTALKMAKAEATLELAYEQSANAIGDYERTQDSYANVARRSEEVTKELREELGKRLIPAAGTLKGLMIDLKQSMLDVITVSNELNTAQEKLEKGLELDITDAMALANEEAIKLQQNLLGLSQGKINLSSLRDLVSTIRGGKEGVEEMEEAYNRNAAILANMEMISKRNERLAASQAKAANDRADAEERAKQAMLDQQAIIDGKYKDAWSEVQAIIDDNKTTVEKLEERIEYLAGFDWPEGHFMEQMKDEAIAILENERHIAYQLEEGIIPQAEIAAARWEAWAEKAKGFNDELTITKDNVNNIDDLIMGFGVTGSATFEELQEKLRAFNQVLGGISQTFNIASDTVDMFYDNLIENAKEGSAQQKQLLREQAIATKIGRIFEAGINTATAITAALTIPPPAGPILAGINAILGGIQVGFIAAQPIPQFALGGDFVTNGPQPIMVGDNPGGRERVSVTPLSSPNYAGPSGGIVINLNGTFLDPEKLHKTLTRTADKLSRRGRA